MRGDLYEVDQAKVKPTLIIYNDGEKQTERTIIPKYVEGKTVPSARQLVVSYIHAFCLLRQQDRMFDYWKIEAVADPVTGELLSRGEWLYSLPISAGAPSNIIDLASLDDGHTFENDPIVQRIALLSLVKHLLPAAIGTRADPEAYMKEWITRFEADLRAVNHYSEDAMRAGFAILADAMKAAKS